MFRIDNAYSGHQACDACRKQVGATLQRTVHRTADLLSRCSEQEFVIILPGTADQEAFAVAEKALSKIANLGSVRAASAAAEHLTLSIGVATLGHSQREPPEKLIGAADQALFRPKRRGRDCIEVAFRNTLPAPNNS